MKVYFYTNAGSATCNLSEHWRSLIFPSVYRRWIVLILWVFLFLFLFLFDVVWDLPLLAFYHAFSLPSLSHPHVVPTQSPPCLSLILQFLTCARNVCVTSGWILIYRKYILESHCHRATFYSHSLSSFWAYFNYLCSPHFFET